MTKIDTKPVSPNSGSQPSLIPHGRSTQTAKDESSQSLDGLPLGEARTIDYIVGDTPELKRRLYALGFVPGAKITKLRVAPLGDPMQVRVGGSSVSIRRQEASMIHLQSLLHSHG
jgi:ferrous iron transport protein A